MKSVFQSVFLLVVLLASACGGGGGGGEAPPIPPPGATSATFSVELIDVGATDAGTSETVQGGQLPVSGNTLTVE